MIGPKHPEQPAYYPCGSAYDAPKDIKSILANGFIKAFKPCDEYCAPPLGCRVTKKEKEDCIKECIAFQRRADIATS